MRLENFELPALGAGQISVRVKAASVNPVDWKIRNGDLKIMTGSRFPRAMGNDFSGIVEAVGPAVLRLKPGDAVFGTSRMKESGAFAEVLITSEKFAAIKPAGLSFEQAASLPTAGAAAWIALVEKANLQAGQSIFINGCLGSVGRAAIQIAKLRSAKITGSCATKSMEEAKSLGVVTAIDYSIANLSPFAGAFDVVFDTAGTLSIAQSVAMLRPGGVALDLNPSGKKMILGLLNPRYKIIMAKQTPTRLSELADAAAKGKLTMLVGQTVQLGEAIVTITTLEKSGTPKGKVVIAFQ